MLKFEAPKLDVQKAKLIAQAIAMNAAITAVPVIGVPVALAVGIARGVQLAKSVEKIEEE